MANSASFIKTAVLGIANLTTANTGRDGSGSLVNVCTADANQIRVNRIRVKAEDNPADSIVLLWIHDGSAAWLYDEVDLGDPADATNTDTAFKYDFATPDLVLPNGYSLKATITVTPTAGDVNVFALGGKFDS